MGILTLLRNAFGRSRKARATEAEGADRSPERTPDPTTPAPTDEHELVAAAFDKVKTPAPTGTTTATQNSAAGFTAETEGAAEPVTAEPAEPAVATEAAEPRATAEPVAPRVTAEAAEPTVTAEAAEPTVTAETRGATGAEVAAEAKGISEAEVFAETDEASEPEFAAETKEKTEPEVAADAEVAAEKDTEPEGVAAEEKAEPEETAQETALTGDAAEEPPMVEVGPEPTEQPLTAEAEPTGTKAAGTTAEDTRTPAAAAEEAEEAERTVPATEAEPEQGTPVAETTESAPEPVSSASEDTPEPTAAGAGTGEAPETTAPQAADGEDAPQEAPAPDDATRTGGAGGNTDTEGEAEADPQPEQPQAADGEDAPQEAPAPDDATRTGGAGGNTDAEGEGESETEAGKATSALPLAELKRAAPALASAYKAAAATLEKTDLTGTRAKLYLVLDRSASMRPYYKDGSAQALADQTLALAAHLDPEATVHVVFFSTEVDGTTDLTLTKDHETKIDDVHAGLGRMGRTSYHAAVDAVLAHYDENAAPGTPALVVFQTDGAPDAKTPATQSLTKAAAGHPAVFFSFVAFGEHDNKAFDYLRKLKTGNTSFFHAGPTPRELTDTELYQGVLATWRP
ncbi:VWA domain-containing protein [Streptomyces sp. NPDC006184]|uniref:VWA domain-containing protein n=1 Tax=Streptomyces sp. NPDC006184 TaxID=3155455 RepID=UPI0033A0C887